MRLGTPRAVLSAALAGALLTGVGDESAYSLPKSCSSEVATLGAEIREVLTTLRLYAENSPYEFVSYWCTNCKGCGICTNPPHTEEWKRGIERWKAALDDNARRHYIKSRRKIEGLRDACPNEVRRQTDRLLPEEISVLDTIEENWGRRAAQEIEAAVSTREGEREAPDDRTVGERWSDGMMDAVEDPAAAKAAAESAAERARAEAEAARAEAEVAAAESGSSCQRNPDTIGLRFRLCAAAPDAAKGASDGPMDGIKEDATTEEAGTEVEDAETEAERARADAEAAKAEAEVAAAEAEAVAAREEVEAAEAERVRAEEAEQARVVAASGDETQQSAVQTAGDACASQRGSGYRTKTLGDGSRFCIPDKRTADARCRELNSNGYVAGDIRADGTFNCRATQAGADKWCVEHNGSGYRASLQSNGGFVCKTQQARRPPPNSSGNRGSSSAFPPGFGTTVDSILRGARNAGAGAPPGPR